MPLDSSPEAPRREPEFRDFIKTLKAHWAERLAAVQALKLGNGPYLPKAHSFYAGQAASGLHVFLFFQHNSKSWKVGQFTVNVILLEGAEAPAAAIPHPLVPPGGIPDAPGYYRIGTLLSRKDKWWHLHEDNASRLTESWFATSYADAAVVLSEAVLNVTDDVKQLLSLLGVRGNGGSEA
jgi:hypothetical protein